MMDDILAQRIAAMQGRGADPPRPRLELLKSLLRLRFRPFRRAREDLRAAGRPLDTGGEWGGP